ncbi:MAG: hypothetical protein JF588_16605 [Caulobacterales bacterium]|nr:hypothetical protein [Caulobacterales bacterium]
MARTRPQRVEEAEAVISSNLPVPVGPAITITPPPRNDLRRGDSEFSAQLMGQEGQRRGLRGGTPLLEAARTAYNRVEWSGRYDRRARTGRTARTEV